MLYYNIKHLPMFLKLKFNETFGVTLNSFASVLRRPL